MQTLLGDNSKRTEILDYIQRGFPVYSWSLCTVDRRLRYFNIYKTDKNVSEEEVQQVALEEISGPGRLLGYRAVHAKIREYHQLNVSRALSYEWASSNSAPYRTLDLRKNRPHKKRTRSINRTSRTENVTIYFKLYGRKC